ncbi:hypothetical protein FB45DRAFT_921808 [Roridomyces roridus]|uniref:Uncharacterized protein n=1 Tax=Roridomyces roridus TaxID=1738132 RepID=A0AAD7BMR6_9AGAR|nr:hypothetical protein FB45DRAFT_921808 [Roridomyces roridus]
MESHAYSDEEDESPVEFGYRQTETPSPRTELLSPTSPLATSPRALHGQINSIRHTRRGPSERFRRQREQTYANVSPGQLLSLLIEKDYEASKLRKALNRAHDRVEAETSRALEAEHATQQTLNQFRVVNEAKVTAERFLAKTSEELRLWKFQFEHAQKELKRAQDMVHLVERQRDDAEKEAVKARTTARQLHEQRLITDAMEEGRRLGYKAGLRRARQEMAYTLGGTSTYDDTDVEPEEGRAYTTDEPDSGLDAPLNASPLPPIRSPQIIRMPEAPQSPSAAAAPPTIPLAAPLVMPSPRPPPSMPPFETETVRAAPQSVRSPSIQIDRYPIEIPSASVFNDTRPSGYPQRDQRQAPPENHQQVRRRPSSQSQHQAPPPPRSVRDEPPPSPIPSRPPSRQEQLQFQAPPDNYIPSMNIDGGIALPPPFQLSQPVISQPPPPQPAAETRPRDSWYNPHPVPEDAQSPTQSWYQQKRPRSNAGSATGRSNAGSATGRSASGRHARHASDAGVYNRKDAYSGGLGAINEDSRSVGGSQRSRSMQESRESLVPPPLPAKDARHQKQAIADELRYSDPDLAEGWRRDAAVNAETASSRSRPPRNVHLPAKLTMPAPLSPPTSLGHIRARSMSGSTVRSGISQPPNMMDLASRPSLRRVKEKRPISPSDSSSQIPLSFNVAPQMGQFLSPDYQAQPLPVPIPRHAGFVPQSVTVPAEITVPVTLQGKPIAFPSSGEPPPQPRPPSGMSNYRGSAYGGSNVSLNRPRSTSINGAPASRPGSTEALPLPPVRPLSSGKGQYVAGPTLTADGPGLTHRAFDDFDPSSYVDPAFFAADMSAPAPRSRRGSTSSRHSGLSYMGP